MTKKEKIVFDTWVNDRQYYNGKMCEAVEKINMMYLDNGGKDSLLSVIEKVEYLAVMDAKTRHIAIKLLIEFTKASERSHIRKALAYDMENAKHVVHVTA